MKKHIKKAIKRFLGIPIPLSIKELLVKHGVRGDIDSAYGNYCDLKIKVASDWVPMYYSCLNQTDLFLR